MSASVSFSSKLACFACCNSNAEIPALPCHATPCPAWPRLPGLAVPCHAAIDGASIRVPSLFLHLAAAFLLIENFEHKLGHLARAAAPALQSADHGDRNLAIAAVVGIE